MLHNLGRVKNLPRKVEGEFQLRLWQMRRTKSDITPVFLVGCGRSGTSMVVWQLERLWQVSLYNEENPIAFDNWRLRDLPVIEKLVRESQTPLIVFKPILNTHQTRDFLQRFPNARVIFAFRHYNDVIPSSIKKFGANSRIGHIEDWLSNDFSEFASAPPPQVTKDAIRSLYNPPLNPETGDALYWLFYNRLYFDLQLDSDPRVLPLQYEATALNPQRELMALCEFLNIPYKPWMINGIFESSVKRDRVLSMDPQVKLACEALWDRLCDSVRFCE